MPATRGEQRAALPLEPTVARERLSQPHADESWLREAPATPRNNPKSPGSATFRSEALGRHLHFFANARDLLPASTRPGRHGPIPGRR
jgi:hypothetical protein